MADDNDSVDRYGVMGYPVSHSRSPVIHNLFAAQTRQNIRYELLEVAPDKLEFAIRQFQRTGGRGLNITAPHKRNVIDLCDRLSERAGTAGAANTLVFSEDGIFGDNTDGIGLVRDLENNLGIKLEAASILLLGAGGATRGIVGPLLERHPEKIVIANRTIERAMAVAALFAERGPVTARGFDEFDDARPFDLVLNATSAGPGGAAPPYPEKAVGRRTVCYDLSYALKPTPFCRWARDAGAGRRVMGWGMLVEQAAESFRLWRGVHPDTGPVLRQLAVSA